MYPMDISRTVRLITETCLNITAGKQVLIIGYSKEELKLASALASDATAAGAEVGIVLVEPPIRKVEPPPFLAEAMKKVDIIVTLGSVDFGHTAARKEATAMGISYAYIPDLMNQEILELNIQPKDLLDIRDRTLKIAEAVSRAKTARVTSAAGTDIELDINDRPGLPLHPIFGSPGHFAIVPFYSEVACAPVEGAATGTVVTDGTVVGMPGLNGVLSKPVRWTVQDGCVVDVDGGKEADFLTEHFAELGENADRIAELGIGTNHKMRNILVGNRRDNAIWGHIHLALGRNKDLGGTQQSPIHADFMIMDVDLILDGQLVIQRGRLVDDS